MSEFEKELQEIKIDPNKIFLKIWTSPREVFKFVNDNKYQKHVNFLLMAYAITQAFGKRTKDNHLENLSAWPTIGMIILGAMVVYILLSTYASLISWTGKWIDGKGDTQSVLRMISYAMIPSIIGFLPLIPLIAIYGSSFLKSNEDFIRTGLDINFPLFYIYEALEAILGIWTIVLCVIGLSEVQKFSISKAILNLVSPAIVLVSIILFLSIFFVHIG